MTTIHPRRIPGRWVDGYALDYHTVSSDFVGYDEYGHAQFDTKRSEIGELLFSLKYRSDETVVPDIAAAVQSFLVTWRPAVDVIVPVTPSRQRASQPVMLLGEEIARRLALPFAANAVRRIRDVPQLKDVHDYDERMRILQGSHEVDRDKVEARSILLFDDLYRSGATMNEITANLYDQGQAAAVYALTITCTRGAR